MHVTNIKVIPQYGSRVSVVPMPAGNDAFRNATREQFSVLLALMAETETSYFTLAEKTGATRAQIDDAIAYWQSAGVLTLSVAKPTAEVSLPKEDTKSAPVPERAAQLPHYNTDEAARFLSKNPSATGLIDCCQQELGKIFNTAESEIIIGMLDYLSLDPEYILLLCAHSAKRGKKSLRYIEKMAISLHDTGILTYEQLEAHLKKLDAADDAEGALRTMFGIGKRALIKREREAFFRWTAEWEMPTDVIERAYEIAVGHTKEPSVPYTNAILEKWHAVGVRTAEDVDQFEETRKPSKGVPTGTSFDTDDFFEAALQRSYGG